MRWGRHTRNTPWGRADHVDQIVPGIAWVSTPSHGGLMVGGKVASEILTPVAIKYGMHWAQYICYEEDCAWSIFAFECADFWAEWRNERAPAHNGQIKQTEDSIKEMAYESLCRWNVPYLLERGIQVERVAYARHCFEQEDDRMRRENDPRLIVSAIGISEGCQEGLVKVWTADNKQYVVKGYDSQARRNNNQHNLLEYCEIVEAINV